MAYSLWNHSTTTNEIVKTIQSAKVAMMRKALFAPLLSEVLSDDPMQQFATTSTTARIEDDAFLDLDLAVLDNLMRGTGEDGQGGTEWDAARETATFVPLCRYSSRNNLSHMVTSTLTSKESGT
ncbi:hypothetical protein N7522_012078 [Penicillium canescens]|nr:hypothetical protein N7522_012078 [Penicillium canescens]